MRRLLIATNNAGKVREIKAILGEFYDELVSLKDIGLELNVVEDGDTFEENAVKKAREAARTAGCDALADDSGLCVAALDGAPGVYSARYAGEHATDEENNAKLLAALKGVENRHAKFVSVVALASGDTVTTVRGEVEGVIAHAPSGSGGFGYDPLFFVPELGQTFAEIPADLKNTLSHRARALAALRDKLCAR
ncbi:MAG: XTP/dITP diphosphatase [Christensenellales bacterium]|jgi:XTP/dITP diphosphohydrolase